MEGMMIQKHIGYTSWNDDFSVDKQPEVFRLSEENVGGYIFEGSGGYVAMEAGHFFETKSPESLKWQVIPDMEEHWRNHINALYKAGGGCYGFL